VGTVRRSSGGANIQATARRLLDLSRSFQTFLGLSRSFLDPSRSRGV
jgi:hypothetical protein